MFGVIKKSLVCVKVRKSEGNLRDFSKIASYHSGMKMNILFISLFELCH